MGYRLLKMAASMEGYMEGYTEGSTVAEDDGISPLVSEYNQSI